MNAIRLAVLNGIDVSIQSVEGIGIKIRVRKGDWGYESFLSRDLILDAPFDSIDAVVDENCQRLVRSAGLGCRGKHR